MKKKRCRLLVAHCHDPSTLHLLPSTHQPAWVFNQPHWPTRLLTVLTLARLTPRRPLTGARRLLIGYSSTPARPRPDFILSSLLLATRRTGLSGFSLGPVQSRHDFFRPHPGSHSLGPLPRPRHGIDSTSLWLPLASSQLSWPQPSYSRSLPVHNPSGMHLYGLCFSRRPFFGL